MLNRIQKLLLSEYTSFHVCHPDPILVESNFAQVTCRGVGLRAVVLGMTRQFLIVATDVFDSDPDQSPTKKRNFDPEIETLELISLLPLDFISIKVCARKRRSYIKVQLEGGRRMYFEFGEHMLRAFYFNIWADRIFALNRDKSASSSGTSIVTTSQKDLYLVGGGLECDDSPKPVYNLERRINSLNHCIKAQIKKLIDKDKERTALIEDSGVELNDRGVAKEIVEIFKSNQPDQESADNIWCE